MLNINLLHFFVNSSHIASQTFISNSIGWIELSTTSVSSLCLTWCLCIQKIHFSFFVEWIFDIVDVLFTIQQSRILCSESFSAIPAHLLKLFHVHIILIPEFFNNIWTKFPSLFGCGETHNLCKVLCKSFGNCRFCGKFLFDEIHILICFNIFIDGSISNLLFLGCKIWTWIWFVSIGASNSALMIELRIWIGDISDSLLWGTPTSLNCLFFKKLCTSLLSSKSNVKHVKHITIAACQCKPSTKLIHKLSLLLKILTIFNNMK